MCQNTRCQIPDNHDPNLLTYSMEQSPSWEASQFAANQEIPRILWNLKVHYRIHKCPLPVPILSQLDNSLAAAVNEPALYRLLMFQVPNLVSLFCWLGHTKVSVQVQGFVCEYFVTKYVSTGRSS
jgi:hypothetical protein